MPLIQKMILTLLLIALAPAFLVGSIFYFDEWSSLRSGELNQLSAIASIQQNRVEALVGQNSALLAGYTARTGLRGNLDRYNRAHHEADQALVQQSVASLLAGTKGLKSVSVLDPDGVVVASTQSDLAGEAYPNAGYVAQGRLGESAANYVARDAQGQLSLYLVGPLNLNGRLIGVAVIETDMSSLLDLTANYTGLGETGETIVAKHDEHGNALYLLPLRFDKTAALRRRVAHTDTQSPVTRALAKQEGTFAGATDYRGQTVLVATRYIAGADWGLVVKIDQAEAYQPLARLSDLLLVVMFILSVVVIFVAFYLARRLNEPIIALAVAADKVRGGDLSARAEVSTKDEIGQLAETFNAMADNVEKVDQMKSEFVMLTSHQLRTPATAVKGFMSMLLDGYAGKISAKQHELVEAAFAENERQISVINSILDVARMEGGEMVLVRAMHDLSQVLDATAEGQAPLLESHGQTIEVVKPPKPVMMWVDASKLQLVVDNLVHNAIKYSSRGTKITVTLRHLAERAEIEVKDQGIGIARHDLHRLFKRFSRIVGPHTANVQGAGLGLYLADKLVAMHGGKIEVRSHEGVGTSFTVTLPDITPNTTNGGS